MATILTLDLSTNTGYAVLSDASGTLHPTHWGVLHVEPNTLKYPLNYIERAEGVAKRVYDVLIRMSKRDQVDDLEAIVIEETNGSKSRYTQKMLEFIHMAVIKKLWTYGLESKIVYVNTSDWRKTIGVQLTAEDKKQNAKLSKAKSAAKKAGAKLDKKKLGIRGKITKKHIAIRAVNEAFNLDFKPKDNDMAEAICIGLAYIQGVAHCDGK